MNYNNKKSFVPLIVVVAICAVVLVFLFMKGSEFRDRTNVLATENELLERDIALVESEGGDSENINRDLQGLKTDISNIVDGRRVNAKNLNGNLTAICENAGIEEHEISIGAETTAQVQGDFAPALMRCDATIAFYGEEGAGYTLIQAIESGTDDDYDIVSFDFQKDSESKLTGVGDWKIVVAVYYFEADEDA